MLLAYVAARFVAESPSPKPTPVHVDRGGLIVVAVVVAIGGFALWWIRRAATRYRRRLYEQDEG